MISINSKKRRNDIFFYTFIIILIVIILIFAIELYLDYVDRESKKILENTDTIFVVQKNTLLNNGLIRVNLKEDLTKYVKKKNVQTVTYKIDGESFYFDVKVNFNNNAYTFDIDKIVHEDQKVNAKMHLQNVEIIEYRTGNVNDATLLNLITDLDNEYLAITENTYYFLGSDIESISYMDDHFYYVSYNPKYKSLENATSCDKTVKNNIDGFNGNNYYYKYGRINFLEKYYQKLSSKTYTVKEKCEELENKTSEEE